eukprot:9124655-Karenia_brevis.AAC.2
MDATPMLASGPGTAASPTRIPDIPTCHKTSTNPYIATAASRGSRPINSVSKMPTAELLASIVTSIMAAVSAKL